MKTCGFIFNSSVANNGTIHSPNYPGYYPRSIDCHYTFYAQPSQKVRIFFTFFDIEGQPPV
uniref:CUB domain-containing protein n=1 Tax=Romanomermis culicivorax TaxID=13658 RepID=A0A915LCQ5_ROMCU